MRTILWLNVFLILLLTLTGNGAKATTWPLCEWLLRRITKVEIADSNQLKSLGGVKVVDLPLNELFLTGVAHVPIPVELLSHTEADDPAIKEFLMAQIRSVFHDKDWEIKAFRSRRASILTPSPLFGFKWHRDTLRGWWLDISSINNRYVRGFTIVVIFPIPADLELATVVRPAAGRWKKQAIQGNVGRFTFFISEVIEHTSPISNSLMRHKRDFIVYDFLIKDLHYPLGALKQ